MGGGILTLVSNIFGAVKEFFGFQSKKLDLKNTQEMKDAAAKQSDQDVKDKINSEIQKEDVNAIRNEIS